MSLMNPMNQVQYSTAILILLFFMLCVLLAADGFMFRLPRHPTSPPTRQCQFWRYLRSTRTAQCCADMLIWYAVLARYPLNPRELLSATCTLHFVLRPIIIHQLTDSNVLPLPLPLPLIPKPERCNGCHHSIFALHPLPSLIPGNAGAACWTAYSATSVGLSNNLRHHLGGSNGRWPPWRVG